MYLIIFEDGEVRKVDSVSKELIQGFDDGYIDILDITIPKKPKKLTVDKFVDIKTAE